MVLWLNFRSLMGNNTQTAVINKREINNAELEKYNIF